MKIIVLNGSPKGDVSVTMQYVHYLEKHFPEHQFSILNISRQIKKIESDPAVFNDILDHVRAADGVLWAFPLYFLLVHAHYKRFIELVFERGAQSAFAGKYAATLSTSIHFYDHTAHNYMQAICDDLSMRFVGAFSADMNDLLKETGQKQLRQFGTRFFSAIQNQAVTQRLYPPLQPGSFQYQPGEGQPSVAAHGKKVVILHDSQNPDSNLAKMVARASQSFREPVTVINLHDLKITASCQGCLKCGSAYECAFEGKDDFIEFYRSSVMTADVLIYAGTIHDRYLSSRWKTLFDRSFFNTHTPVLGGKQAVFLVSGPLGQIPNLVEIFKGYFEFQQANLVGIVTDECADSAVLDRLIDQAMQSALDSVQEGATMPMTFLGEGGMKIFRDDIWGRLRLVFLADYRAFRKLGFYKTFPQRDISMQAANFALTPLLSIKPIRQKFDQMVVEQMIAPYQPIVKKS